MFKEEDENLVDNQGEANEVPLGHRLFIKCNNCKKEFEMPKGETLKVTRESLDCILVIIKIYTFGIVS